MFKLDLEKAEEPEIKLPISAESSKKQENFRKTSTSALLRDYAKAFDCVEHNKLWKILKEMGIRPPYLSPDKPVCRSGSNSWNQTWNNGLLQNWERSILSRL